MILILINIYKSEQGKGLLLFFVDGWSGWGMRSREGVEEEEEEEEGLFIF
jgi:hypothetical protein